MALTKAPLVSQMCSVVRVPKICCYFSKIHFIFRYPLPGFLPHHSLGKETYLGITLQGLLSVFVPCIQSSGASNVRKILVHNVQAMCKHFLQE